MKEINRNCSKLNRNLDSNLIKRAKGIYNCRLHRLAIISLMLLTPMSVGTAFAADLTNILSMIRAAPANSWIKMNTNNFQDAWVPSNLQADPGSSYTEPQQIIAAWSSFAWDSNRGNLILFGGGHANYAGDEVYIWNGSTQQWSYACLPSALDQYNEPVDGGLYSPQSSHTYDNQLYLPKADRFVTFGGAAFQSGSYFLRELPGSTLNQVRTGPYFLDPSVLDPTKQCGANYTGVDPTRLGVYAWENRDIYYTGIANSAAPVSVTGTTDYAYQNGKEVIFVSGPNSGGSEHTLAQMIINNPADPTQDQYNIVGINWTGSGGQGAGAYDPVHNLYIKTYVPGNPFTYWDLSTAGPQNENVQVTLTTTPTNFVMQCCDAGQYGLEYDPVRNRFLLWGGGSNVFQLTVTPGTNGNAYNFKVTQLLTRPSTQVPPSYVENGVLGKWHYASNLDVFVGLEDIYNGNVWFFKPSGWVDPAPPTH